MISIKIIYTNKYNAEYITKNDIQYDEYKKSKTEFINIAILSQKLDANINDKNII